MGAKQATFECAGRGAGVPRGVTLGCGRVEIRHEPGDPPPVARIRAAAGKGSPAPLEVDLLPSKGLSLLQAWCRGKPLLWEPPLACLPDPDTLDLAAPLLIGGEPATGYAWITAFTGGIEMLGLRNWGMPRVDARTGEELGLHGDVSLIPVEAVTASARSFPVPSLTITATFLARSGPYRPTARGVPWHRQGEPLYEVRRSVTLEPDTARIVLADRVTNVSRAAVSPEWGYHVQLRPEPGARFMVASREVKARGGGQPPADHEQWRPAAALRSREERGFVHAGLRARGGMVETLLRYPDGSGTLVLVPRWPFVLSWFSAGGAGDGSIMMPGGSGRPAESVFLNDWNGVGPEIGTSDLDHGDAGEPGLRPAPLGPGKSRETRIVMQPVEAGRAERIERRIRRVRETPAAG